MRLLYKLLPLLALLLWSATAVADYNPADPPEPGVNFTLTTRCEPAEAGTTNHSTTVTYPFGRQVNIYTTARTGFRFVRWRDGSGTTVSTSPQFTYTMPVADVVLTACYEYDPSSPAEPSTPEFKDTATVTYSVHPAGAGSISGPASGSEFEAGTTQSWTAYTNTGYRFLNWTLDGEVISTATNLRWTAVRGEHHLTANYEYSPGNPAEPGTPVINRALTLVCDPPGAATLYGAGSYAEGTENRVYGNVKQYYRFVDWTDDNGDTVSETLDFKYTMPGRKVTLTAHFIMDYNPANPGEPGVPVPPGSVGENMVAWPRFGMADQSHVMILCETPGSEIHYTLDGTDPDRDSPVYTGPVYVERNLTVKAIAYVEGMEDSPIRSFNVTSYHAAAPKFRFINRKVEIYSDTPGATIRYTLDFSDPTEESEIYTQPLEPEDNCRIKAYASCQGLTDSPVSIYVYRQWEHMMSAPVFTVTDDGKVAIGAGISGAVIRYTTDGSVPDGNSPVYSAPLEITGGMWLTAYAAHEDYFDSETAEFRVAHSPGFAVSGNSLTITTATEGGVIHYTTDGTAPTEASPVYTEPIAVSGDMTVRAVTVADGMEISPESRYGVATVTTPVISYIRRCVEITTATEAAVIRYTTDGSVPTSESAVYTAPIELTEDCTVRAYASKDGMADSGISEYIFVRSEHTLSAPEYTVVGDVSGEREVSVSVGVEGAVIRYTTDGSSPTSGSTVYSVPLKVTGGMWLTAYAAHEDYFDSETAEFRVAHSPGFAIRGSSLTITTATEGGVIHYTTDGTAPTEASPVYTEPIAVSGDMTVRAVTVAEGMEISPESRYSASRVSAPVLTYTGRRLSMATDTEGAVIRYTTDGSVPTSESAVYTAPIEVTEDCTVRAYASKDGMADSGISEYIFVRSEHTVPTPVATYAAHRLTLECADTEAVILYAVSEDGGDIPSSEYTAPLEMTRDCTVTFKAVREGFFDSETAAYRFEASVYTEPSPRIEVDYRERTVTAIPAVGYAVAAVIDGAEIVSEDTAIIDVTPGMESISVYTPATDADRYDSESVTLDVVFHLPPVLDYDGHSVSMSKDPADPASGHAEIWGYFNDNLRVYGSGSVPMDVYEFGTASADCRSDHAFRSEPAVMTVDLFNTGRKAGVRGGHRLAEVFGTWGDDPYDYTYLSVRGEVEPEDLRMLGRLPVLTVLDLEPYTMADGDYDGVFAGSRIETLSVNAVPDGILRGMPRLTTVHWGLTNAAMPDGALTQAGNPNLLLWLTDAANAPADAVNTVIHGYIGEGYAIDPEGPGTEGHAGRLTLTPGYPFNVHMPLEADHVELTKEFTQYTVIDVCGGWETIALPFAPDRITHESRGDIVPFAAWDGSETGPRPFWLYEATPEDWNMAESVEAGRPYIISMPNNDEYIPDYNLAGRVTFEADGVRLTPGDMLPVADEWISGMMFEPVWMPVEGDALSLNAGHDIAEWLPGSVFTADVEVETLPFGACVRTGDGRRNVPVFGGGSGMSLPSRDGGGTLSVWLSGGSLYVSSTDGRDCEVRTLTGITVRRVHIGAGETVCVGRLAKGVYIIGTVKVMVP